MRKVYVITANGGPYLIAAVCATKWCALKKCNELRLGAIAENSGLQFDIKTYNIEPEPPRDLVQEKYNENKRKFERTCSKWQNKMHYINYIKDLNHGEAALAPF